MNASEPRPKNPPRRLTAAGKDAKAAKRERLPIGSHYVKVWHGKDRGWVATLSIPDPGKPGDYIRFHVTGNGSFTAEQKADDKYREWLKANGSKPLS